MVDIRQQEACRHNWGVVALVYACVEVVNMVVKRELPRISFLQHRENLMLNNSLLTRDPVPEIGISTSPGIR
jgi:hypothetical protein